MPWRAVGVLLMTGGLVVGGAACGGDESADTSPTEPSISETSGRADSTSPTSITCSDVSTERPPIAAPIEYGGGDATLASGHIADFAVIETGTASAGGESEPQPDATFSYRLVSNDPRVEGDVIGTHFGDYFGTKSRGAIVQWGEATLSNDGGSWEASYAGVWTSTYGDVLTRWWRGTGDYEGLTFYMWITGGFSDWEWTGLIFSGDPPPPIAS